MGNGFDNNRARASRRRRGSAPRQQPPHRGIETLESRRLLSGGEIDTTFGASGALTFDFAGDGESIEQMLPAPGGKVMAFGYADSGHNLAVARFNSDGTLDTTFGAGGKTITSIVAPEADLPGAIAVNASNGKFAAVYSTTSTGSPTGVAMFTATGALDTSFSTDGLLPI